MKGRLLGIFLTLGIFAQCSSEGYSDVDVKVEGEFQWEMLFHIDNRGKHNEFKETRTFTRTTTTSYARMRDDVVTQSVKAGYDVKAGGLIEILNVGFESSVSSEVDRTYQETVTSKREDTVTEDLKREFTVGADSEAYLYQLVYRGPGVTIRTETISTDAQPMDKVIIRCKVRSIKMLDSIVASYGENPPTDSPITEYFGGETDINSGQGGKYVYLVSRWTEDKNYGTTGIQIVQQNNQCGNGYDLAAGAGGKFRCMIFLHEENKNTRIRKIQLVRTKDRGLRIGSLGFDECTADINAGRGGDFLYLCWANVRI